MLQIENRVDLISAGNKMFEQIRVSVKAGHMPSLPINTKIETNAADLTGTVIYKIDERQQSKKNNTNDDLTPILFIICADTPQETIYPSDYKKLFMFISPSIFDRQKFIRKKLKVTLVQRIAIIIKFFTKVEYPMQLLRITSIFLSDDMDEVGSSISKLSLLQRVVLLKSAISSKIALASKNFPLDAKYLGDSFIHNTITEEIRLIMVPIQIIGSHLLPIYMKYRGPHIAANPSPIQAIVIDIVSCLFITISIMQTYPTHGLIAPTKVAFCHTYH
ncbi:UNKNOWN [Stylonychia lemnae]|uniref:Uncharacterized protein n=1 Tax=Stylonychia lemnae TaxID=5949 RepID=A0A078A2R5_STYLE|nr:UNKNOWN [Stylonychia lemnae]|eukprot:CDW75803.1 UNKNOWN [Stylonychia lemnae]